MRRTSLLAGVLIVTTGAAHAAMGQSTPAGTKSSEKVKRPRTVDDDINAAVEKLKVQADKAEQLVNKGDVDGASKLLLGVFPEASRTPAEYLVLGKVLYRNDRQLSYQMVKVAAEKLPDYADAQLEWALAQHRTGEYAGALKAYERANELKPGNAPLLGVAAEAALRTGDVKRAIELWKACLNATRGSVDDFEKLVCEVNFREDPLARRKELVKKVAAADEEAAVELLLLDCDWPLDWWIVAPNRPNLESDNALVGKWILPGGNTEVSEAKCVAACALMDKPTKERIGELLKRSRYLLDDDRTLPTNSKAMVQMLKFAIRSGAISREEARSALGQKVLEVAKKSSDPDIFEAAAFLYLDTAKLSEIDRMGWEKAKDPRSAASLISTMYRNKELKWDTPEFQKAREQFPENTTIAGLAYLIGSEAGQPKKDLLVQALKAEYRKFSKTDVKGEVRARSDTLRHYWKLLIELEP
ncbi:MAG: hypothetical protein JSS51_15415 [Planctomycetes bacterium]|nr:hypothetical protein [Planctomycetota bacterium]